MELNICLNVHLVDTENKSRIKHNENNIGIAEKAGKMWNMQAIHQFNLLTRK